ncbi:MAG: winged helix-turn-helix domain-containing protein [Candidatus Sulfotelmatobacter sp.]
MPSPLPSLVRFANFEVNLRAGELRRQGSKVRLQEQPFSVLTVLLESAGEVVTREELRKRLWSADTFVDFDHRLAVAVSKLRDALRDSAENPKFVRPLADAATGSWGSWNLPIHYLRIPVRECLTLLCLLINQPSKRSFQSWRIRSRGDLESTD